MDVIGQDVGQIIVFSVTVDGGVMDLTGAAVTLVLNNGRSYDCAVQAPATAGVATRTTLAGDFPANGSFQGVLRVEQSGAVLYSRAFDFNVKSLF
jgi:hypothetical protein